MVRRRATAQSLNFQTHNICVHADRRRNAGNVFLSSFPTLFVDAALIQCDVFHWPHRHARRRLVAISLLWQNPLPATNQTPPGWVIAKFPSWKLGWAVEGWRGAGLRRALHQLVVPVRNPLGANALFVRVFQGPFGLFGCGHGQAKRPPPPPNAQRWMARAMKIAPSVVFYAKILQPAAHRSNIGGGDFRCGGERWRSIS